MNKIFYSVLFFLFISVVLANFSQFYQNKNYEFIVEASCDSSLEDCFIRDCSTPDECPPNELEIYKQYSINAVNFKNCEDNSCAIFCSINTTSCTPIKCDSSIGDTCLEQGSQTNDIE